jgi:hypothetical protein
VGMGAAAAATGSFCSVYVLHIIGMYMARHLNSCRPLCAASIHWLLSLHVKRPRWVRAADSRTAGGQQAASGRPAADDGLSCRAGRGGVDRDTQLPVPYGCISAQQWSTAACVLHAAGLPSLVAVCLKVNRLHLWGSARVSAQTADCAACCCLEHVPL